MRSTAAVLLFVVAATSSLAQDLAEIEVEHNADSRFVTPHTVWARPYALGTTRVLFFARGHDTAPREIAELQQRFDFDAQMVFWARLQDTNQEGWHGDERGIQRMTRLLSQEWDAFVFAAPDAADGRGASPDMMPPEQQLMMLQAVTEGAGLVLLGIDDPRVLKDKNKLQQTPAFLSDIDGVAAFTVLKGRGVRLPKRPAIEYRPGWEVDYDEWAMRAGKAILWAASKEPKLSLTLSEDSDQLAREALPGTAATLQWQGGGAATAEVVLRRSDGVATRLPSVSMETPDGTAAISLPVVRAGDYHLDAIAREGDRVAAFGSVRVGVTSERRVQSIALTQDWAETGDTLWGKVTVVGPASPNEKLYASLFDRRGREIARQTMSVDADEKPFSFQVKPWFPMLLEVRATLVDGEGQVSSAWQFTRVVKRHHDRFNFIMWDHPRGDLAPWVERSLADSGVTVQLAYGTPEPHVAAYDISWIPYTTHIGKECDPVCWADEDAVQAHVDAIVDKHISTRQHGVFVYSLGDEIAVRGSCLTPHCLDAYREYLQEQYGDIAALNASWGADYAGFDEVQLSEADDNDEKAAFREGNFPRWFDRQAFQSYNFCKLCERFGEGFRRIDPESRCGFEGAGTFRNGDDLDGLVRSNDFWSPYPGTADEVVRSIAPRDFPRSNWMGYTKDADTLLQKYWRMVTRGCDAVWWWRWNGMGRFHGWLSPTLEPYPAVEEILRDTRIVRDGLGDLLISSEMQTDGVGIMYSHASAYAANVQSSPTYDSYEANHEAFHAALRELGLNFLYFTDRQMRLGEVDLNKFKAIILPFTQAMGAQEAEMLREYVRDGGLLMADVRPAIYDGHVKPLKAGQLDDVFGASRTVLDNAIVSDGQINMPSARGESAQLPLPRLKVDGGVRANGATAEGSAGDAPLWLTNTFGEGRALLVNAAMASYPKPGTRAAPEAAARLLALALKQGQVVAEFGLMDQEGERLRNVEITRWTNGPVQIISLFRHAGDAETATLSLPRSMHVYDLKRGKGLGESKTFPVQITPCRAVFLALSPEPLEPVKLSVGQSVARGDVMRVAISSALPEGQQAVRLEIKLPNGEIADWIDLVVLTNRKGATVDVPVALNDPVGTWTVSATELYTGTVTTAQFTVR